MSTEMVVMISYFVGVAAGVMLALLFIKTDRR
jgi:hypothetical protein